MENLVKFVKGNFIAGRSFHDDVDLAEQCAAWLSHVNSLPPTVGQKRGDCGSARRSGANREKAKGSGPVKVVDFSGFVVGRLAIRVTPRDERP